MLFWQPPLVVAVVPTIVCRGRRVVFLRGTVYIGGESSPYPGPPRRGAPYVLARPVREQAQ